MQPFHYIFCVLKHRNSQCIIYLRLSHTYHTPIQSRFARCIRYKLATRSLGVDLSFFSLSLSLAPLYSCMECSNCFWILLTQVFNFVKSWVPVVHSFVCFSLFWCICFISHILCGWLLHACCCVYCIVYIFIYTCKKCGCFFVFTTTVRCKWYGWEGENRFSICMPCRSSSQNRQVHPTL